MFSMHQYNITTAYFECLKNSFHLSNSNQNDEPKFAEVLRERGFNGRILLTSTRELDVTIFDGGPYFTESRISSTRSGVRLRRFAIPSGRLPGRLAPIDPIAIASSVIYHDI